MSNTGGPFSDPYGSSSGASNPYGGAGASNPYDTSGPVAGGSPSPYGGIDQGPYTNPAQAAPSSGGPYADPYGGGTPSYQPPGAYGPPGGYASGGYGGYPPVMNYQNAAGGWSLGLGIAALVLCFVPVLTQGIAIAAIITGVIGRKAVSEGRSNNGGMAVAGIIIGAASLLISIIAVIVWLGTVYRL